MSFYGKTDILSNELEDIVFKDNGEESVDLEITREVEESMLLALKRAIKSKKNEWPFYRNFGASPKVFVGRSITPQLFTEIENKVFTELQESNVFNLNQRYKVTAAPITKEIIAIRIECILSQTKMLRLDYLYNTTNDSVEPVGNGAR